MTALVSSLFGAAAKPVRSAWRTATGTRKAEKAARKEQKSKKDYIKRAKKGETLKKISPYSKEQDKLVKWLSKSVTGKMSKKLDITRDPLYQAGADRLMGLLSGDPAAASAFAAPMEREFREQIMPEIAQRYAGAGAGRSSAFQSAAASAGGALTENLAAMREQLAMGAIPQALQYAQQPLANRSGFMGQVIGAQPSQIYEEPYMSDYEPVQTYGAPIGGAIGAGVGAIAGGPMGAIQGYQLGSGIGGAATDVRGSEGGAGFGPGAQSSLASILDSITNPAARGGVPAKQMYPAGASMPGAQPGFQTTMAVS
jgi:hypothetical protein